MASDLDYLLQRSEKEAVRSIGALQPAVAAVHSELCLLYTGRALAQLITQRPPAR